MELSRSFGDVQLRVAAILLASLLPFYAPLSAQLYLHSSSEEKRADAVVANLTKARDAHLGALDAHRTWLTDTLARERTLTIQREMALRDQFFTSVMSAPARGEVPLTILQQAIASDWTEITGDVVKPDDLRKFADAALDVDRLDLERSGLRRDLALFKVIFEGKGGEGIYCDQNGVGTPSFQRKSDSGEADAITHTCAELAETGTDLAKAYARAGSASALLGDPTKSAGGAIAAALADQRAVNALIPVQAAIVRTVTQQMNELQKYYDCELKRTNRVATVSGAAAVVQKALDDLASGDRAKVFDVAALDKLLRDLNKKIPACDAPPPDKDAPPQPPKDQGTPGGFSAQEVITLVGRLDKFAAGDALLAGIQEQALDLKASKLSDLLTSLATSSTGEQETKTAKLAAATLRLFGHAEQIALAQSGKLPDTVGVLVALADARMRQATAKIEADRLAELRRLAALKITALRQRAVTVADASVSLEPKTDTAFQMSLLRYASSWSQGSIPATVVTNDMTNSRYLPWVSRERAVVEASYAMLEPAGAELQVYGKGGLTAATIAQFLQAAGLGAIAVTK